MALPTIRESYKRVTLQLHYRRIRGDMIETYKIMTGKYNIQIVPSLVGVSSSVTRGHSLRLQKIGQNMIYVSFFC